MSIPHVAHNLIDRALDIFQKHQRGRAKRGELSFQAADVDDVSFVAGFMSCYGVLSGTVDVGWPKDAPLTGLFEKIQRDLADYATRVHGAQVQEMKNGG